MEVVFRPSPDFDVLVPLAELDSREQGVDAVPEAWPLPIGPLSPAGAAPTSPSARHRRTEISTAQSVRGSARAWGVDWGNGQFAAGFR